MYVKDYRDIVHVFVHQPMICQDRGKLLEHKSDRLNVQTSTKGPGKY